MEREWIDKLLSKTDIVKLISRYVPLNRKGGTWWGCCPFHHEKEPSFAVNEAKQFFHCFGCKESGNAITFIEKIENVDFLDAVKLLAEDAHMEVPLYNRGEGRDMAAERKKRDRLYALNRDAARHYHENLSDPKAARAAEYLQRRQIPQNLIVKFGLGASLGWYEMIDYLVSKGYTKAEIKEAGIADQKADRYYDVFADRVMYPIINHFGEVVGFGGRTLEQDANFAKYRNTSQTQVFDKSRTIYGINLLKKKKQRERVDYIIVTEGYMDVIALHKAGFDTAVASMGTALTRDQAKMLKNYCERVYISYDGDTAGQKATLRGLDILADAGLNVRVVSLPEGLDPDDVIKTKGKEFYEELLRQAVTLPAFKINTLLKGYDLTQPDGKSKFAVEAVKVIKALYNPVEQEEYLRLVREYTGYSMEALKKQADLVDTESRPTAPPEAPLPERTATKLEKAALFVMASVVHGMDYVDHAEDIYPLLSDPFYREIYVYVLGRVKQGDYSPSGLFTFVSEENRGALDKLMNYDFVAGDDRDKYINCLLTLKVAQLEREKAAKSEEYAKTKNPERLKEIQSLDNKLKQMKCGGGQNE